LNAEGFLAQLADRRRFGMKPGLDTIRAVLADLGNPQDGLKYVHVAGTNGKGATCALLDSVLRAAGLRTFRYTSPHLVSINERFFCDGVPVADEALECAAGKVFSVAEKYADITFFECLTAVAFVLAAELKPDVIVLETGLGGRLDATNVVRPEDLLVAVITRIGMDHCDWLGTTYPAIASEKAGIIKRGRPVVLGAMPESARDAVARAASLNGAPFVAADDHVAVQAGPDGDWTRPVFTSARRNLPPIALALGGAFQIENALTAMATAEILSADCGIWIPDHAFVRGFSSVIWPGRFQFVDRDGVLFVVDGAHNPDGAMAFRESLRLHPRTKGRPAELVAGFCGDKDVLAHLRIMSAVATSGWAVPIRNARSLDPAETAERMMLAGFTAAEACGTAAEAFDRAASRARADGGVVAVCGSLFLAGEALEALGAFPWPSGRNDPNELSLR